MTVSEINSLHIFHEKLEEHVSALFAVNRLRGTKEDTVCHRNGCTPSERPLTLGRMLGILVRNPCKRTIEVDVL